MARVDAALTEQSGLLADSLPADIDELVTILAKLGWSVLDWGRTRQALSCMHSGDGRGCGEGGGSNGDGGRTAAADGRDVADKRAVTAGLAAAGERDAIDE